MAPFLTGSRGCSASIPRPFRKASARILPAGPARVSGLGTMEATETSRERRVKASKAERLDFLKREVAAQHDAAATKQATRGKRGARERVLALLDEGSFQELDPFVRHRATQFGMEKQR